MHRIRVSSVVCYLIFCISSGPAFSQNPDELESLLASAQQAQAKGDFDAAAGFYRQAVVLRPDSGELKANLGLMYYQTGNNRQAIQAFQQALRSKPELFVPNLFLGLEYVKAKRPSQAIPYLKRAAHLKPTDIQAESGLGQAYFDLGETRNAIASYMRVVQFDPRNADGWFHLGVSYLEQVESDARLLSARYKDSGYLHTLTAESLVQQKQFAQAADEYKAALSSRSFPREIHAEYGFDLLDQHRFSDAEREFRAELVASPGSLIARLGLARLLIEQGHTTNSLKQVEAIYEKEPAFLKRHIALLKNGLPPEKNIELKRAVDEELQAGNISQEFASTMRSAPDEGNIIASASPSVTPPMKAPQLATRLFQLAQEQYAAGSYEQCTELLAPRLEQLSSKQLATLVSCAYPIGDYETTFKAAQKFTVDASNRPEALYWETKSAQQLAIQSLARAGELNSASLRMHVLLGDVYRERSYFPQAEKEYRKALELQPEDSGAMFGLCLILMADRKTDQAFQLAQADLKQRPDDPELNVLMGEILCAQQNFSAAEPYLKKGLNSSLELTAHAHALLGKVYAETDRPKEAIAELKLALDHDSDGHIHYQIGRLYLKIGDQQSAQKAFDASARIRNEEMNRAALRFQSGADETEAQ